MIRTEETGMNCQLRANNGTSISVVGGPELAMTRQDDVHGLTASLAHGNQLQPRWERVLSTELHSTYSRV